MNMRSVSLLCLVALVCLSQPSLTAPPTLRVNNARQLAGYFSQPGTFPLVQPQAGIVQQIPGVNINAYFDKATDGGSGSLDFKVNGYPLMLSLYSSKTVLPAKHCIGFSEYDCDKFNCTRYTDETDSITFANFSATGYHVNATVFIDQNYWVLKNKAILMDECVSARYVEFGKNISGIIGMGVSNGALDNFIMNQTYDSIMGGSESVSRGGNPMFSIFLNADGKSGDLMFLFDSVRSKTQNPLVTLEANTDWIVDGVSGVQVKDQTFDLSTKLIFDINADTLGLPVDIYNQVMTTLNGSVGDLSCPTSLYRPRCHYTGELDLLPDIKINVGDQVIIVPGAFYAEKEEQIDVKPDAIFINIRALQQGNTNDEINYVTDDFANYIILDQHVMGYYYTLFDTTKQDDGNLLIKMYVAQHGSSSKALVTIIICTVIGLIVGLSIYRYKKIKKARMAASPPLLQNRMGDQEMSALQGRR